MGSSGMMLNEIDLEYELSWRGVGLVDVGGTELLMTMVIGGKRPQTSLIALLPVCCARSRVVC